MIGVWVSCIFHHINNPPSLRVYWYQRLVSPCLNVIYVRGVRPYKVLVKGVKALYIRWICSKVCCVSCVLGEVGPYSPTSYSPHPPIIFTSRPARAGWTFFIYCTMHIAHLTLCTLCILLKQSTILILGGSQLCTVYNLRSKGAYSVLKYPA